MSQTIKTADFLVELGTEELPPTALKKLSEAFAAGVKERLVQQRLSFNDDIQCFATPRRLAVLVSELQTQQADQSLEKLGPAIAAAYDKEGNPSKAALGFARSNGVEFSQLEKIDTDKGERLCFKSIEKGQAAKALLGEIVSQALANLPIPKRMRWGASRTEFVRPVHWLVMLLDDQVIDAEVLGLKAGNQSKGHRFHSQGDIVIKSAQSYAATLHKEAHIIANFSDRRAIICEQVEKVAATLNGFAVVEDDLLDEVTALVEYPAAIAGSFDAEFLSVPKEALISSMNEHQKYFHVVKSANDHTLLPHFITVSNIDAKNFDAIIGGNERVIRPRLADAAFFFETDKKHSLGALRDRLKNVVFQKDLGTVFEKTQRIGTLAAKIATAIGGNAEEARQGGELCKADLASDMVLEFDKMQGIAGGYYARHEGLSDAIALSLSDHYLPRHAGDHVPSIPEACAVAIADRLDTITGIFGIGQEPSGSKDPFALRRASIGILQIILRNELVLDLRKLVEEAIAQQPAIKEQATTADRVCRYIFDRFTALYQEQGVATEVIQAVRAVSTFDALDFQSRVEAVNKFVEQPDCEALAAANKRVSNILEKSDVKVSASQFSEDRLTDDAEKALSAAIDDKYQETTPLFAAGKYREGLLSLTTLKPSIDNFFDNVMVNADDPDLKNNRLALLAKLRDMFIQTADIALLATAKK